MSYAIGQLTRALARLVETGDPAALEKVRQWEDVIAGVRSGTLEVGSRTPVADTPAWVTLEVAHGGFATGRYLSEVPLTDDEEAVLPGEADRERLNLWYLSDDGQAALLEALRTGRYRIEVPEDAALAVVTLLLDKGFDAEAVDLVAVLRPLMHRLRFTPQFEAVSRSSGTAVRLASIGEVTSALRNVRLPQRIGAMRETLGVWNPLYDRLVALWCRTVDGELPYLDDGVVRGGWPCKQWPEAWADERAAWIASYEDTVRRHRPSGKHAHPKGNFVRLYKALRNSDRLSARDIGWIRRAIANTVTRNGAPGSDERTNLRATQEAVATLPTNAGLADVLVRRLGRYPADGGLPSVELIEAEVSAEDTRDMPEGTPIPEALRGKAVRALEAPIDELIGRGVITSGEVLAIVLPQLTSRLVAADIADPVAAALYEQTYTAFRRRRSLLLLDLAQQVRFSELPWAAAMDVFRKSGQDTAVAAKRSLQQVSLLAITEFPHAILPNPLVSELSAMAERAGMKLPLVEEVAADIFMGKFTTKWRDAAIVASRTMAGTLYANYYDLPPESHWTAKRTGLKWGKKIADDFGDLCESRAKEAVRAGKWSVARNGSIIEQSQILTTHNLAVLVSELGLADQVRERAKDLAWRTFSWAVTRLAAAEAEANHHARLVMTKNAAYAWRQAIYLLSFCSVDQQLDVVRPLDARAGHEVGSWFQPAMRGLEGVIRGERFSPLGTIKPGRGRRFLGWTDGRNWAIGG